MRPITFRAAASTIGLSFVLGAGVAAITGGVVMGSVPTGTEAVSAGGAAPSDAQANENASITAPSDATWEYVAPTVEIVAKQPTPAPARVRAVASNPIPPSVAGNAVLEEAAKYVGVPYLYGGTTPAGFDCSGFVSYVYAQLGITLPHSSSAYWNIGTQVSAADAKPGDIIVSDGHVAIYAGDGMQIDSPRKGKTIQFRAIWQTSYIFVRVS